MKHTTYMLSFVLLLSISAQTVGMHRPMNSALTRYAMRKHATQAPGERTGNMLGVGLYTGLFGGYIFFLGPRVCTDITERTQLKYYQWKYAILKTDRAKDELDQTLKNLVDKYGRYTYSE